MKRIPLFITVLIVLLLCTLTPPPAAQSPASAPVKEIKGDDHLLVPGKRVGVIELGADIKTVESRIGNGEIAPRKDFQIYHFVQYSIDVSVQKDTIIMILVTNRKYRTQEGFCVGGSISPVIRQYGKDYEYEDIKGSNGEYLIQYWEKGISFSVKRERITRIKIFNSRIIIKK